MFHWVQTVQRNRDFAYFPTLTAFVDNGDYTDRSFINMINRMLGGDSDAVERRTAAFANALRAFNLIQLEGDYTGTRTLTFCGVDYNDAGTKCTPCESNLDCAGIELCYANVRACDVSKSDASSDVQNGTTTDTSDTADAPIPLSMAFGPTSTTNYCGESWSDAALKCSSACE